MAHKFQQSHPTLHVEPTSPTEAHSKWLFDEQHTIDAIPAAFIDTQREILVHEIGAVNVQHAKQTGAAWATLCSMWAM